MSRNLGRSYCCENIVRLEDMRGKPIEFRRYSKYAPHIGCRWQCPTCNTVYFAWWVEDRNFSTFMIDLSYYESFNDERDTDWEACAKFLGLPQDTHVSEVSKQWWLRCPDEEPFRVDPDKTTPRHLCLDNAEEVQEVLGDHRADFPRKKD